MNHSDEDFYEEIGYTDDPPEYDTSDEIVHYGVKGQKHGVRRYQYEDMSLTPEGRVHYNVGPPRKSTLEKLDAKIAKQKEKNEIAKKKAELKQLKSGKIDPRFMSDDELAKAINRYRNEDTFKSLQNNADKSALRRSLDKAVQEAISKVAGKSIENLGTTLSKKMTDGLASDYDKMVEEANYWKNKASVQRDKNALDTNNPLTNAKKDKDFATTARDTVKAKLEYRALAGDDAAMEKLREFQEATGKSGKKGNQQQKQERQQNQNEKQPAPNNQQKQETPPKTPKPKAQPKAVKQDKSDSNPKRKKTGIDSIVDTSTPVSKINGMKMEDFKKKYPIQSLFMRSVDSIDNE